MDNHWCGFQKAKCGCSDTSRYERFTNEVDLQSISEEDKDSTSNEKEEKLVFFNDDGSFQTLVVERNLCTSDLCQLLVLKNRVSKSVHWSIIEHLQELGLERLLEDHEYVLSAYRDMRLYSKHAQFKYIFRKDFRKYEFFHHPEQFFPSDMLDLDCDDTLNMNSHHLQNIVSQDGHCPVIFSQLWVKDQSKQAWAKAYLLLRDKKLYLSYKVQILAKFMRAIKIKDKQISDTDINGLSVYATLTDFHVYSTLNAKNQFRAPTEWGICLRPTGVDTDSPEETPQLRCLACDSERVRTCWLTAMRLSKYGKQLRENYRAFKNKQAESINTKDYNSYTVPNESVRSRVAMDFTGSVGRIVEDPKEAKAIAVAEGYSWRRRFRPMCRVQPNAAFLHGLESGVHIIQPWFHSGMSRDQATALVSTHGTVDGVFLVRESRSNPGSFVLTYKCGAKVLHAQITPIIDPVRESYVFSLDSGVTKFYDLLQLVEFYQLNAGCLPTRLTHYVVQNVMPTTTNISSNKSTGST